MSQILAKTCNFFFFFTNQRIGTSNDNFQRVLLTDNVMNRISLRLLCFDLQLGDVGNLQAR